MAVIAVGDFDKAAVETLIKTHFSRVPAATSPRPRPTFDVPDHPGTRFTIATDPEATNTVVSVTNAIAARDQTTIGAYRQQTAERVVSGLLSARYAELGQKPDAPFLAAGTSRSLFVNSAELTSMERAFRWAHEVDPQATLLYNDYNEHNPGRRAFLVGILRDYRTRGVPIHGVGFQGHVGLEYPDLTEYEKSIEAIAGEGLKIHVTELDVDVLPRASGYTGAEISTNIALSEQLNPWKAGLPPEIDAKLTARYRELFTLFLKHRRSIARVTTWGAFDGESWKNNFPVRGRTNYPLLFDRQLQPKAAYAGIVALKK